MFGLGLPELIVIMIIVGIPAAFVFFLARSGRRTRERLAAEGTDQSRIILARGVQEGVPNV